jgi:dihydroxyacetone kinase-like protein
MSDGTVSLEQLTAWLGRFAGLVTDQRAYLTELDSAIGDADHGANMARGMTAVM